MVNQYKKIVFTIAYGNNKYSHMAEILGKSIKKHSPKLEFQIYTEKDISNHEIKQSKDNRRGKIEICKKLNDPNTKYIFIDADSFVFCDVEPLFDYIEKGAINITWEKSPNGKWDGIEELNFPKACKEAGIKGDIKSFHLNSGFMMWQGGIQCFEKALELFDTYTFNDRKGQRDDEYYINAGIQLTKTKVIPVQDMKFNPLAVYWVGNLSIKDGKLHSSYYKKQGDIQHYGGQNYDNYFVKKIIDNIENNTKIKKSNRLEYVRYNFLIKSYRENVIYRNLKKIILLIKKQQEKHFI